jgi:hypothetical protein
LPIQIGVGLNSGEVVVHTIAAHLDMDSTAVGQTTIAVTRSRRQGSYACDTRSVAHPGLPVRRSSPTEEAEQCSRKAAASLGRSLQTNPCRLSHGGGGDARHICVLCLPLG